MELEKYKGVSWHPSVKKWVAVITVNRKQRHLGVFESEVAAARTYNVAAHEAWGDHARLNVIPVEI